MIPHRFLLIAGEASGDLLAAELVSALKTELAQAPFPPQFFGAGGPKMAAAGVELAFDLTVHSVIGLAEALKNYRRFKRQFDELFRLALAREPDAIICVDFSGFNRRFALAIKKYVRARQRPFNNWNPKIIQYVSPQVWASRPGRARQLARDLDLLLSLFPFEEEWYAARVPRLRVEFVGHPMVDRHGKAKGERQKANNPHSTLDPPPSSPLVLLLPGSRVGELKRHLPVMVEAASQMAAGHSVRLRMVLPNDSLATQARPWRAKLPQLEIQTGGLAKALAEAELAFASTGTVTLECACFGVPTVAIYKTSWSTYLIAKNIVTVKYLAMPNLLAGEPIFPEFIQHAATPENLAREAPDLLNHPSRRAAIKAKLSGVIDSLGAPGASQRAAHAILKLLREGGR